MTDAERMESEADQFAMELLMPENLLRASVSEAKKRPFTEKAVEELARKYAVPVVVMTLRLMQLKLIKPAVY